MNPSATVEAERKEKLRRTRPALVVSGYLVAYVLLDAASTWFETGPGFVTWYPARRVRRLLDRA